MITGIPNRKDFEEQGLTLLNLAWDTVADLFLLFADAENECGELTEAEKNGHLIASHRPLAIATALLQQGAEFMVKAAIADYSPFLLISAPPSNWPRRSDKENVEFSAFKTVDASDLIKIHDTVAANRFSPEFTQLFGELRRVRNSVFHTVDKNLSFSHKHVIDSILRISSEIMGKRRWTELRLGYLQSIPSIPIVSGDPLGRLSREFVEIMPILNMGDLKEHFGFNRKQRQYICPRCTAATEVRHVWTAQLEPNTPTSTSTYCPVCRSHHSVIRETCKSTGCRGNVLDADQWSGFYRMCLTCSELGLNEVD
ncbi:MAG: hypothetical protein KDN05_00300 [Verrucomicrobiae bacterium]|nr:hypothetical protein [Verrucomicrobiae bacterium]